LIARDGLDLASEGVDDVDEELQVIDRENVVDVGEKVLDLEVLLDPPEDDVDDRTPDLGGHATAENDALVDVEALSATTGPRVDETRMVNLPELPFTSYGETRRLGIRSE
jgi:hypothetical protein